MAISLPEETAARFLEGEPEAVSRVRSFLSWFVSHRDGYRIPADERDDVIQEVFRSLLGDLRANGVRSTKAFEARVRHHAHCRCTDHVRRESRRPATTPINDETLQGADRADRGASNRERMARIESALERAGPKCVELMRLRLVDGLSWRSIAEKQGENENRLRQRLHKCIRAVRAFAARAEEPRFPRSARVSDAT